MFHRCGAGEQHSMSAAKRTGEACCFFRTRNHVVRMIYDAFLEEEAKERRGKEKGSHFSCIAINRA